MIKLLMMMLYNDDMMNNNNKLLIKDRKNKTIKNYYEKM